MIWPVPIVVVLDHHPKERAETVAALEHAGCVVIAAADASDALDIITRRARDIVLLLVDAAHPEMTEAIAPLCLQTWAHRIPLALMAEAECLRMIPGDRVVAWLRKPLQCVTFVRPSESRASVGTRPIR